MRASVRFAALGLAALLALWASPSVGASAPPPAPTAADWYHYATDHLQHGQWFERSARQLREAIHLDGRNPDYPLALGCALASRAAAIADAAENIDNAAWEAKLFAKKLAAWEAAPQNPNGPGSDRPRPVPPPAFVTRDDNRPFRWTKEEASQKSKELAIAAMDALNQGVTLARSAGPADEARAEYVRGWAICLLARYETLRKDAHLDSKEAVRSFRRCTELAPSDPNNWHALAVAHVPFFLRFRGAAYAKEPGQSELRDALAAFDKAAERQENDFDLHYQIAAVAREADPALSLRSLRKAVALRPANAVLWYLLAYRLFEQAPQSSDPSPDAMRDEALHAVERGNRAAQYRLATFDLPVPPNLRAAWNYQINYGGLENLDFNIVLALAERLEEYVTRAETRRQESAKVLSAISCLLDLGRNAFRHYAPEDNGDMAGVSRPARNLRLTVGTDAFNRGVKAVERLAARRENDTDFARVVAAAKRDLEAMQSQERIIWAETGP